MERLCMKRGNQTVARGSRADIYIQIWVKISSAPLLGSITLFYVSSLRAYFLPQMQSGDKITFLYGSMFRSSLFNINNMNKRLGLHNGEKMCIFCVSGDRFQ